MSRMERHDWNLTPKEAIALQRELAASVVLVPLSKPIRTIAGADISLNRFSETIYAGMVVLSYPELVVVDSVCLKDSTPFPYIPGLLSFREVPALLKVFERLAVRPDLIMLDGAGVAHPRGIGVATHFGLLADIPTIGCAKSRLTGKFDAQALKDKGWTSLWSSSREGESIGTVFQSKRNCRPLFVSAGYKITQKEAFTITQSCLRGYRLPEPTRLAHNFVNACRIQEHTLFT